MTEIILIAGVAANKVIGKQGELPWHIKEDLQRFKNLTLNHPIIMGRKTYEEIIKTLGNPLPERTNIVLTRDANFGVAEGVIKVRSVDEAIAKASEFGDKIFVIGGQQIYEQTIDKADKLEITKIHKDYEGDTFFPEINMEKWKEVNREDKQGRDFGFSFVTYQKKPEKKGIFVAFEGIDGCGKSTQIRKLVNHIFEKSKYHHIILTRNPYKDVNIRKILTEDNDPLTQAEKLADLFINDRKKQVGELVKPNLEMGHFVISDRYKLSTITYQAAQGLKMEDLIKRHEDLPIPNITFIIDVSPEVATERMKKEDVTIRGKEHKFEANLDFVKKLRENHHKAKEIFEKSGEKVFIINGEQEPERVFEDIKGIFEKEVGEN